MTILYHPRFADDIQRFASKYEEISPKLAVRFRQDIDGALLAVMTNPTGAGALHQHRIMDFTRGATAQP